MISGFVGRRISQTHGDMIWALLYSASPCYPPLGIRLSHEREELGEVVFLEEQQHGDLVPACWGRGEAPLGNHCGRPLVIFQAIF